MIYPLIDAAVYKGRPTYDTQHQKVGDKVIRTYCNTGDLVVGMVCEVKAISRDGDVTVRPLVAGGRTSGWVWSNRFVPFMESDVQDLNEPL